MVASLMPCVRVVDHRLAPGPPTDTLPLRFQPVASDPGYVRTSVAWKATSFHVPPYRRKIRVQRVSPLSAPLASSDAMPDRPVRTAVSP